MNRERIALQVATFVCAFPGQNGRTIADGLVLDRADVEAALYRLEQEGTLRRQGLLLPGTWEPTGRWWPEMEIA